jgi:hypothetical protein
MQITKHIIILRDDFPYHLSLINIGLSNQQHRNLILQRVQESLESKYTKPSFYSENTFYDLLEGLMPEASPNLNFWNDFIHYSIWYFDGCPQNDNYGGKVFAKLISCQSSSNPLICKSSSSALSSYYRKVLVHLLNFIEDF